jgi:hypothetical protein
MNPRLELASLDSMLDARDIDRFFVAAVARQMQRISGHQAAVALRRGRRAPMVSLQLATFAYTNLVASAVRRTRAGGAGCGHLHHFVTPVLDAVGPCERALAAALDGDPGGAIEQLQALLRDKRVGRIVDELQMGAPAVAIDRLEALLAELTAEAL